MLDVRLASEVARSHSPRDQVGTLAMVDHGEAPVGSANSDLSVAEDKISVEVVADIEHQMGNVQLDAFPDRLLVEVQLARHDYYYCCYCCRRYLSQKVADGAAVFPVDDRTESRNFSLEHCIAKVHQ